MNEHKINIRHKVKLFRESKGFSQDYVANKIQLSQNALSKIERGEIKISFEKACVLAEALETDFDTLVNFNHTNSFNNCQQFGVINTTIHTDKNLLDNL